MSTLTKSLHTVTAVTNVARILPPADALTLAGHALSVLGYDVAEFGADDPTVAACVKAIRKAGIARSPVAPSVAARALYNVARDIARALPV